jgi:polyhydroxybutyrate depolymerase
MNLSLIVFPALISATALGPGDQTRTLQFGGLTRSYLVHVPPHHDAKKPTPVVLVYHGAMTDGQITVAFTGLNEKADKEGFIAVYPNGTGRFSRFLTWNGGNCCGSAQWNNVDDVGFTRVMLDDLAKVVNVDTKRVFATGISNGGIMCYRLASELSDRIAAIAPVAGTMGTAACTPKRPVPVMHFHGTDDKFVPVKGGRGDRSLAAIQFYSVDRSIQSWVKADGCPEKPATTDEPTKFEDGTSVVRKVYGPGKEGSEVVLYLIQGGGHTWPGRDPRVQFLGTSTKNISANDLMWDFFKRHPMK